MVSMLSPQTSGYRLGAILVSSKQFETTGRYAIRAPRKEMDTPRKKALWFMCDVLTAMHAQGGDVQSAFVGGHIAALAMCDDDLAAEIVSIGTAMFLMQLPLQEIYEEAERLGVIRTATSEEVKAAAPLGGACALMGQATTSIAREIEAGSTSWVRSPWQHADTQEKQAMWLLVESMQLLHSERQATQVNLMYMLLGMRQLLVTQEDGGPLHDAISDLALNLLDAKTPSWIYERAFELGVLRREQDVLLAWEGVLVKDR